jgi:hypothetical protein
MRKPKKSTVVWTGYLALGLALDGYLLREGKFEDTLTHYGRRYTGVHPAKSPARKLAGQAVIIAGCVWVANHFAFGPHENGRIHRLVVDGLAKAVIAEAEAEISNV